MSFLQSYVDYAKRLTDAPPAFHLWVGIGLLATALGNGAWTWAWGKRLCANLWIILLADSGVLRKSTSLGIGQTVLAQSVPDALWPSEWSYEGLLGTMQEQPAGVLFASEFKRLHAALSRDYSGGSKELYVDTYDNPELTTRRTIKSGTVEIRRPAPNIIAATTRDWFEASLAADDVGGGFLSRMVIVPAKEKGDWRGIGATRSDADGILRASLSEHLKKVRANMAGEVDTQQIQEPFNEWLKSYEESWNSRCTPELAGTIARSGANALKLAMIFQADSGPCLRLSLDSFERAKTMVGFGNEQIAALLAEGLGLDPEGRQRRRVLAAIKRVHPDPLPHSDCLRNLNVSARSLERHVTTLVEAGEIIVTKVETTAAGGRPGKAYRWLNGRKP